MQARPHNIIFVLTRPVFLGNIGSVARAIKNFGFTRLRLVSPPRNYKDAEARKMAAGAFDILKHAEVFDTLSSALEDVSIAAGTTSGKQRQREPETLRTLAPSLVAASEVNPIAWVFGDEINGLTRNELERCHHVVTIPTNPDFPSLNISHAVAVVAYEMSMPAEAAVATREELTTGSEDDEFMALLGDLLDKVEFSRRYNRDVILREMRTAYQRMSPTRRELDLLMGAVRKVVLRLHHQ